MAYIYIFFKNTTLSPMQNNYKNVVVIFNKCNYYYLYMILYYYKDRYQYSLSSTPPLTITRYGPAYRYARTTPSLSVFLIYFKYRE